MISGKNIINALLLIFKFLTRFSRKNHDNLMQLEVHKTYKPKLFQSAMEIGLWENWLSPTFEMKRTSLGQATCNTRVKGFR